MTIELLPQYALLKISGDDAASFLQGQLSNDVTQLVSTQQPGNWQFSGYCNPKGRLLALFYLWKAGDDFYALLDESLVEAIQKRLRMFVMRSKVLIEHIASSTVGFSSREQLEQTITDQFDRADQLPLDALQHSGVVLFEDNAILAIKQRYLLVSQTPLKELSVSTIEQSESWQYADIQDGLPRLTENSAEVFIPQMLNLDLLDGINFKKGCYTGQEIVARMHYLGKLKQRMLVCTVTNRDDADSNHADPALALPGDKIYLDAQLVKSVGNLVSINADHTHALAVVRLEHQQSELYLNQHSKLSVNPKQPYLDLS